MSEAALKDDQFAQWREWVATENWAGPQVEQSDFTPGWYKTKMGKRWVGVVIWADAYDGLHMERDGRYIADEAKRHDIWAYCRVVTAEEFQFLGADKSADPVYAALPADAANLLERVKRLETLPTVIESDRDASHLADVAHVLKQIENTAAERQKEQTAPLKERLAKIEKPLKDLAEAAKTARASFMKSIERHLKARNKPGDVKGQLGKAISLRKVQVIEVADTQTFFEHMATARPDAFFSVLDKLAKEEVKAGREHPGVSVTEDRRAQ